MRVIVLFTMRILTLFLVRVRLVRVVGISWWLRLRILRGLFWVLTLAVVLSVGRLLIRVSLLNVGVKCRWCSWCWV